MQLVFQGSNLSLAVPGANAKDGNETLAAERVQLACGEKGENDPRRIARKQMLLGDRPADLKGRQGSLSAQILRALFVYDDKPCLKTVGYFQEAVLFQDHLSKLRGWFRPDLVPPPPAPAFPELDETSVLVHIRSCNCGFYFLPFEWFDFVLTHMQKRGPPTKSGQQAQPGNSSTSTIASTTPMKVYLVLTPTCRNSDLVKVREL